MKSLLFGIILIIILGVGGLVYRNAVEHPSQPIACPMDAEICPDGTSVSRTGLSCTFPVCPPPNVSLSDVGIAFAVPTGFSEGSLPDTKSVGAYEMLSTSPTGETTATIVIHRYEITASTTALETIKKTAISGASGAPVGATSFSSTVLGSHRFTVVSIERFEGVIDTAYYLARATDVLRFDAIDRGTDWTNPNLDVSTLPAHAALVELLSTLRGE
ncbi:MAG: hypothetical protein WC887_00830 [Candidatus Paceibacterota bacterium]|jgi:hypothetical protein